MDFSTKEIEIKLRAGVAHRWHAPNFVVVSHVYGNKPRLKWIAPLPPDPLPVKRKRGRPSKSDIAKLIAVASAQRADGV